MLSRDSRRKITLKKNIYKESTDIHWRCKNGAGSWNYRIKIPVELPIEAREEGSAYPYIFCNLIQMIYLVYEL